MGKHRSKKNYSEKLSEKLKRIINSEITQYVKSGITPNFSKIYKILEKNKNRSCFMEVLDDFENYLISFVINRDSMASELDIPFINLSNTSVEAEYKRLLKEVKKLSVKKEKPSYTAELYSQGFQQYLLDNTKLVAEKAATETLVFTQRIGSTFISALKNPLSSAKALTVFTLYALANNPVAGLKLIQNKSSSYLQQIEILGKSEWYRLYDDCDAMLNEFDRELAADRIDDKTKRNFFEFLKYALDSDVKNRLSEQNKEKFFKLTQSLLNQNYSLSESANIKLLYNLFNVYLRLDFTLPYADQILSDVSRYAKRIADYKEDLQKEDKRAFTDFFWMLNVNFDWYGGKIKAERFIDLFYNIKSLGYSIYRWDNDSTFSFRTALAIAQRLRNYHKDDTRICNQLDQFASNFVDYMMRLAKSKHYLVTEEEIKESFYLAYVRNLPESEQKTALFSGKYKAVSKEQVFPNSVIYTIPGSNIRIKIFLQQPLSLNEKKIVEETIRNTYARVEKFKQAVHSTKSSVPLESTTFNLYLFDSNKAYVKYGPLWRINTAGGGYTHVRTPEMNDRPSDYEQHKNEKWYEAFVYKQPHGDSRDGENKEGRGFRNLGHEVQHKFFYALIGHAELHNLPSWLTEGGANALGNEACFKEEANYIKQHENKLPSMQKINAMTYASGADHYYFGSALFRFMLEQDPNFLGKIINSAKAGGKADAITTSIKAWINDEDREEQFSHWLKGTIHTCSLGKDTTDRNPGTDRAGEIVIRRNTLHDLAEALQHNASNTGELMEKIDFKQENIHTPLNKNGDRIIHFAIRAKNWSVIWKLLLRGASLDTCNYRRVTAYAVAHSSYSQEEMENLRRWKHDAKAARLANNSVGSTLAPSPTISPAKTNTIVPGVVALGTTAISWLNNSTVTSTYPSDEVDQSTSFAWREIVSMAVIAGFGFTAALWAGYRYKQGQSNKQLGPHTQTLKTILPMVTTPTTPDSDYGSFIAGSSNASQSKTNRIIAIRRGLMCREVSLPSGMTEKTYLINLAQEKKYLIDSLEKRLIFFRHLNGYEQTFGNSIKKLRGDIALADGESFLTVLAEIGSRLENKQIKVCEKGYSEIESVKVIIESLAQRFRLLTLSARQPLAINYLTDQLNDGLLIAINQAQGNSEILRSRLENLSGENKDLVFVLFKRLLDLEMVLNDSSLLVHSRCYGDNSGDVDNGVSYYQIYKFSEISDALAPWRDKKANLEILLDSSDDNKKRLKKYLRDELASKLQSILGILSNFHKKAGEIKNKNNRINLLDNIKSIDLAINAIKNQLLAFINYENGVEDAAKRNVALRAKEQPLLVEVDDRSPGRSSPSSSSSSGFLSEVGSYNPRPRVLPKPKVAAGTPINRGFYQQIIVNADNTISQDSGVSYYNFPSSSRFNNMRN